MKKPYYTQEERTMVHRDYIILAIAVKRLKIAIGERIHKLGVHFWKFNHDTGWNEYYECTVCGKRKVKCPSSGYQPIDRKWLEGGE